MEEERSVGGVLEHLNVLMKQQQLHDIIFPALDGGGCPSETGILAALRGRQQDLPVSAHRQVLSKHFNPFGSAGFPVLTEC